MRFSFQDLDFQKIILISEFLKERSRGFASTEETCQAYAQTLYEIFSSNEGSHEISFCQIYKSCAYSAFPADLKNLIQGDRPASPPLSGNSRFLALMASINGEKTHLDENFSNFPRALCLDDPMEMRRFPLFADMIQQIGLEAPDPQGNKTERKLDRKDHGFGFFLREHTGEAQLNGPPADGFVPHDIRSIFCFGGIFTNRNFFIALIFSRKKISRSKGKILHALVSSLKSVLIENELRGYVFQKGNETKIGPANNLVVEVEIEREKSRVFAEELAFTNQALKESERKLTVLSDLLPGMVYCCLNSKEWPVDYVSEGCKALTGFTPEEFLLGKISFGTDVIHPEDRERVWNEVQEGLRGCRPFKLNYRIIDKHGREKHVWERGEGVFNAAGELEALEGFITDVTWRKDAEHSFWESQRRLEDLIKHTPALIFMKDLKGVYLMANDEFAKISKFSKDEIMGKTDYELFPPEFADSFVANDQEVIKKGVPMCFEEVARHEDGLHTSLVTKFPIKNSKEEIVGICGICIDITDKKKAEEKLNTYMSELQKMNEELEGFTYTASHDLQEPLRKIILFGDRLKNVYRDQIDPGGVDYIERMQKASLRMQALIDDLLAYSRMSFSGLQLKAIHFQEIVDEVLEDLEASIEEKKGKITVGDLPTLEADQLQMRQLFQNLISNSLKYCHPDRSPEISITSFPLGNGFWEVFVEDNGIGFPEKFIGQIFKPFKRLHSSSVIQGTGMGLFICNKIIERHGGKIEVTSHPGKGSTFVITLPERREVKREN
ncbi:MAG: hypothetical protein COV67_08765 [Nitrospinae bacterium CG11_big_fil_rev_8_21_14_0_20_56_8]|nr:MAG: hypothetical protein COV67_08765 [Nitrospinae bacterium CG11_big_fil_rev_8_21_14_0_20_56_8]